MISDKLICQQVCNFCKVNMQFIKKKIDDIFGEGIVRHAGQNVFIE